MQAAKALGLSDGRIVVRHLLPNTLGYIIVSATLGMAGAILTESALSFLGLGVVPPTPTWGNMIQYAREIYVLKTRPWLWMPPGICILLAVMSINLIGDGLRDAFDPKSGR
jgi:peptide/nickel transport system permease protein